MRTSLWSRLRANHGLAFMWILVWLFTLSSVIVNGAHALDITSGASSSWMRGMAVVVASFFPFAGLVMTEAVLIMIRSWRVSHWWVTAMQALLVVASLVMLVVAFWRSFNALTEMAVMLSIPASDAWMLPVLTDTGIVVGTIGVVLAEVKMKIDGDAAAVTEAAEAAHRAAEAARVADEQAAAQAELEAQRATERAAQAVQYAAGVQVLAPAEAVAQPAIERSDAELSTGTEALNPLSGLDQVTDEHGPAQLVQQSAAQPEQSAQIDDEQAPDLGMSGIEQEDQEWLSDLLSGLDEGVEQVDWIETEQPGLSAQLSGVAQPEQSELIEVEQPEHATEQTVERSVEQTEQSAQIEIEQPVAQPEQSAQTDARSLAERAHSELNPKVSVEVLAELIEASRAGASQRRLGDMAGVSANTAARYVQAAERLGATTVAAGTPEGEER